MAVPLSELSRMPDPQLVYAADGTRLATYTWGDVDAPVVVIVHGFASNVRDNWVLTGWVRELTRAGYRVLALDQRGHGASDKPHEPDAYAIRTLVADVETVMDTYLVEEAFYVGYSLGSRVGWEVVRDLPQRIERAVLGGVPDGIPLERLDLDQVRAYVADGTSVTDRTTQNYIALTERVPGNDLRSLLALAEGMRTTRTVDPDPANAPTRPILFATGSEDAIIEGSRTLSSAAPNGRFFEIPGRHHFNAPGSRAFKEAALAFLSTTET
ncbi:alpha/beta fold hydrolase [Microbacterium aerolatum]|uniref:Hydrolase n=1 Tax=Microbacterium aerolatum TaxID=153731 RepID=A0A511ABN0_9MICO|nr:alpha/beta hydrolase [Microbacterium aerolatum]GEK85580.1 hydrolase [Microbacterium aerolatum]GGB22036.1 hydrolase [Microbacterium aerolatum]